MPLAKRLSPQGWAWRGLPGDDGRTGGKARQRGFYTYLHGTVLSNATTKALDALHAAGSPVGSTGAAVEGFAVGADFREWL